MTPTALAALRAQLQQDEGCRLKPYTDTVGKLTIGYGRNLTDNGLSQAEAEMLLDNDLPTHIAELERAFPVVLTLADARQEALGNMAFNMGVPALSKFSNMWAAIDRADFAAAAREMLDSTWAKQVGARATRCADLMRSGVL